MSFLVTYSHSAAAADHGAMPYDDVAAVQAIAVNPPPRIILIKSMPALAEWDKDSTATHDGVSVIKVTAITNGRYVVRM